VLSGKKVERLFHMTDFSRDESARRFARQLKNMGVDDELRKLGAKDGDIVRILEYEFEFID
jgi:GTP-binding protein